MHQNNGPVHNCYLRLDSNFSRGFQRLSRPASKSKIKIRHPQYFSNGGRHERDKGSTGLQMHNPNYTRFCYESAPGEVALFGYASDHAGFEAIRAKAVNVGTRSSGPSRPPIGAWKNLQFLETSYSLPFGKVLPVLAKSG